MSRRPRSHYRPSLGWILGVAFEGTLTRPARPAQEFTCVRCCSSPRASSPHGLTAPASRVSRRTMLRAVAFGSRLLPTRPAKDLHLQSSAHAGHTFRRYAALRASSLGAASSQPRGWSTLRRRSWSRVRRCLTVTEAASRGSELHGYPIPRRPITFDLDRSRMRENRTSGSARGARSNPRPYRDRSLVKCLAGRPKSSSPRPNGLPTCDAPDTCPRSRSTSRPSRHRRRPRY